MKLVIFAKKRTTKDGREFTAFVTKLKKRDGSEVTTGVKFREECGQPTKDDCPCIILVDKDHANLATKTNTIVNEDTGEIKEVTNLTLWVNEWHKSDEIYRDSSLDEFED